MIIIMILIILTRDDGRRSEREPERCRKEDQRVVGRKII
jgi:hypothetical protein